MGCFPCGLCSLRARRALKGVNRRARQLPSASSLVLSTKIQPDNQEPQDIAAMTFTFQELADATESFSPECMIGVGSYGKIYVGKLKGTGKVVAIEHLDKNRSRRNTEFLVEVLILSLLDHPNLMELIGYCAEGDERLLVHEHLPLGSLDQHLHKKASKEQPLNWSTRMKIALGVARGLEYLHEKANPPVLYRNLKPSNILVDNNYNPKLYDFGLAKLGPTGDKTHVSTSVMGTYGYVAPEYERTGRLSEKADVYSFGVVLLELISGQKAIDITRVAEEQKLVSWARNIFDDPKKFEELADPYLQGDFPAREFKQAVDIATMCVQEDETERPTMRDVVTAITYLSNQTQNSSSSSEPTSLRNNLIEGAIDSDQGEESLEDIKQASS